jgi:hypothetical protein
MAHFYGEVYGGNGTATATRLGTKKSGITAKASGWNVGGRVTIRHNEETGQDEVSLFINGGSDNSKIGSIMFGPYTAESAELIGKVSK